MCTILNKTKKKTAKGYKAVIKKNGKYYSPYTGMEYKVGMKIPKLTKLRKNVDFKWGDVINDITFHEPLMHGRTGVIVSESDCNHFASQHGYTVLEMTLGGEIYDGKFTFYPTYIGTEILKIKELG